MLERAFRVVLLASLLLPGCEGAAPTEHALRARSLDLEADGAPDSAPAAVAAPLIPAIGAAGYDPSSGLCIPNSGDLFAPGMQARVGGARVPLDP